MDQPNILWVDDEIDLLKPHILFLEEKGYQVTPSQSGTEALKLIENQYFNIVFLDENMPGMDGLETLQHLKEIQPEIPVVMITNNQEEKLMEEALGAHISDYLLKPVHPNQILISLKKNLDLNKLIVDKANFEYQKDFRNLSSEIETANSHETWVKLYKKMLRWEQSLERDPSGNMSDILHSQLIAANKCFADFIALNYPKWIAEKTGPCLSHQLYQERIVPELTQNTLVLLIDNLRYDQWMKITPSITPFFTIAKEEPYISILPTATHYARNAIFSGLTPLEMKNSHRSLWKDDLDQGGKNLNEAAFFKLQLERSSTSFSWQYHKISNAKQGQKLVKNFNNLKDHTLNFVVYNTIDILSHSKTEMEFMKELAPDDKAYRSITKSWFDNSPLMELLIAAKNAGMKVIVTTDHGTINVKQPMLVKSNKEVSTNLRYKTGKNIAVEGKEAIVVNDPNSFGLPSDSLSSNFVFATQDRFFAYPNSYNNYVNYYRDTYQHGGVSLEEMILPFVVLLPKM